MSRHAFVSYSRADSVYVSELIAWLSTNGVPVWSDAGIGYGSEWPAALRDAVDRSGAVVVVMSPAAESSEWVDRELARAELKGLPVLPLLLEGDPFFRLGSTQYEDVRGGRMPQEFFVRRLLDLCGSEMRPAPERPALPILIHDGARDVYERVEPLAAHLAGLLRSIVTQSEDPFVILERPGTPGYFAQVAVAGDGSYQVEYCDGGPERHYGTFIDDADVAAGVLAGWVDGVDGWDSQFQWERVRYD
jgi:hypothetical protein